MNEVKLANLKKSCVPFSVAIASAITANAKMLLMKLKIDPNNKLLYSDTDSILMEKLYLII
jgi:hypothetical protein